MAMFNSYVKLPEGTFSDSGHGSIGLERLEECVLFTGNIWIWVPAATFGKHAVRLCVPLPHCLAQGIGANLSLAKNFCSWMGIQPLPAGQMWSTLHHGCLVDEQLPNFLPLNLHDSSIKNPVKSTIWTR